MAKLTTVGNSVQAATTRSSSLANKLLGKYDRGAHVKRLRYNYVNDTGAALADGSIVVLADVGPCLILPSTNVATSAMGAARVLNMGLQEYTPKDTTTAVAAVINSIFNNLDVSAAVALKAASTDSNSLTLNKGLVVTGRTQVLAKVTGGTIPAGATIDGFIDVIDA